MSSIIYDHGLNLDDLKAARFAMESWLDAIGELHPDEEARVAKAIDLFTRIIDVIEDEPVEKKRPSLRLVKTEPEPEGGES